MGSNSPPEALPETDTPADNDTEDEPDSADEAPGHVWELHEEKESTEPKSKTLYFWKIAKEAKVEIPKRPEGVPLFDRLYAPLYMSDTDEPYFLPRITWLLYRDLHPADSPEKRHSKDPMKRIWVISVDVESISLDIDSAISAELGKGPKTNAQVIT